MHDLHIFLFGDNGSSTLVFGITNKMQLLGIVFLLILYHVPVVVIARYVPVTSIRDVASCGERNKRKKCKA
jgi:hypothetical protein